MGRKGCRVSGEAGILSGWARTLHGMGTAEKGHGSDGTQRDVRRTMEKLSQFPYRPEAGAGERKEGGTVIRDREREAVKNII